jgi:hypothetical protein
MEGKNFRTSTQDVRAEAKEVRRAVERPVRTLARPAGEAVGREGRLDGGEGPGDEQVLGDAVAEGQGVDAAGLGILDPEPASASRRVAPRGEVLAQAREPRVRVEEEPGDRGPRVLAAGGPPAQRVDLRQGEGLGAEIGSGAARPHGQAGAQADAGRTFR